MMTDAIQKASDQYRLPGMMPDCIRECVTWASGRPYLDSAPSLGYYR